MNWLLIVISLITGIILGIIYFGGLWITVRYMVNREHPYFLIFISFGIRLTIIMAGLYIILVHGWVYLVISLVGFILTRILIVYVVNSEYLTQSKISDNRMR
jgi:F1F0 ATPase subunit 2